MKDYQKTKSIKKTKFSLKLNVSKKKFLNELEMYEEILS